MSCAHTKGAWLAATYPLATSQTLIVRSLPALTIKSSLGMYRADEMVWSCPKSVLTFFHSLLVSQILIDKSDEQLTAGPPHATPGTASQPPIHPPPPHLPRLSPRPPPSVAGRD